jgi:hypothetical protein
MPAAGLASQIKDKKTAERTMSNSLPLFSNPFQLGQSLFSGILPVAGESGYRSAGKQWYRFPTPPISYPHL